jgi:hypothetical protein
MRGERERNLIAHLGLDLRISPVDLLRREISFFIVACSDTQPKCKTTGKPRQKVIQMIPNFL